METSQSVGNKCQYTDCHSAYQDLPGKCFSHMVIHGSRRFHCSKCNYTANEASTIAKHLKLNCGGKCVDKLDQEMIEEWRRLAVTCYPKQAKEIDALITKKEAKLLASPNLQIDRSAKCQYPNCRSKAQHDTVFKRFQHSMAHGPPRFHCSNCDSTANEVSILARHFKGKIVDKCRGKIVDKLDQEMIEEWRRLAVTCYPKQAKEIDVLIKRKEAKLLASSNLQIDRNAKCQYPNCQSKAQHDTLFKRFQHLIAHGRKRFTCSNCDGTGHQLSSIKKHFRTITGCPGKIIDHIDQTMIDEWTKLARVCFPPHVSRLTKFCAKQLAKNQKVPKTNVSSRTIEIADVDIENTVERNGLPQIEETQKAPLMSIPYRSRSINDVWEVELNYPTTSGDAAIQPNESLSLSPMSSGVKDESSPRTQPIHQQDRDLQLQQLTQEVVGLKAENQMWTTRVAEEKNGKDEAKKLLGDKVFEIEMLKKKIRQLKTELDKHVVTLD